ncbi:MAG: glycosyltransferase family 4 protein [Candidatus Omnitrophota bacterium]
MKILFLANHLNTGGITSYLFSLARGLKKKGHGIYLASSVGDLLGKFKEANIDFIPVPMKTKQELSPKIILSALRLKGIIKKEGIEVVHSQSRTTAVLGALLWRITGIIHISTCHGFFKRRLSRVIFPCWGRKVIAISEQVKGHLEKDFGVAEEKICLINNGIDTDRFKNQDSGVKEEARKKLGLESALVVGIVARLSDVKGHIFLLTAMKEVLQSFPDTQLLIVGEGKMKERLLRLADDLGIRNHVVFLPRVDDAARILAAIDVFTMPSLEEGLGLALMEAMAQGLAVVGSSVGGIKTLIQDGYNGLLVKPKDARGLALKISQLLGDEAKRRYFGNNARNFILNNFSLDKMVSQTERVYEECLSQRS